MYSEFMMHGQKKKKKKKAKSWTKLVPEPSKR